MRFTILKSGASYTVVDCHTYRAIRQCRRLFSDGHDNLDLARWWRDELNKFFAGEPSELTDKHYGVMLAKHYESEDLPDVKLGDRKVVT